MKPPKVTVKVKFLHNLWKESPLEYGTEHSVGLDLRACIEQEEIEIDPGERFAVPSGVAIEVCEPGIAGFVYSRSGLGAKDGLTVAQGVGVIDPDYRGEIKVFLLNTSGEKRRIKRGQRIAQLVFQKCWQADIVVSETLGDTDRGAGGFGHTGKA